MKTVKARKLLCILLTLCLMLPLVPVLTFAEGTAVAKIGNAEYDTLQKAVDAAKDGDTVELLADVTDSILIAKKSITLNGNNHKIERAVSDALIMRDAHVVVNDLTLTVAHERNICVQSTSGGKNIKDGKAASVTFNRCTFNAHYNSFGFNQADCDETHEAIFKDCKIICVGKGGFFYAQAGGSAATKNMHIVFDNTVVEFQKEGMLLDVWGTKNKVFTIDVKNGSRLIAKTEKAVNSIMTTLNGGEETAFVTVNLDATSSVEFDPQGTACVSNVLIDCVGSFGSVTINDAGATHKYSKTAYEKGSFYPTITPSAKQNGFAIGDKVYPMIKGFGPATQVRLPAGLDATNGIIVKVSDQSTGVDLSSDASAAQAGYTCRIGAAGVESNYYVSLMDAIKVAESGATITMIADTTASLCNGNYRITKALTIDGNNKKLTLADNHSFFVTDAGNLTIKDLTMHCVSYCAFLMRVYTAGNTPNVTLENCNLTADYMVFKVQAKALSDLQTITLKNSTVTSGSDDWMLLNDTEGGNAHVKLIADNTTISSGVGTGSNSSIFKLAARTDSEVTVELKNNSKLIAKNANHGKDNIIFGSNNQGGVRLTVIADATTVVELDPGANIKTSSFLAGTWKALKLQDGGITWKVSATALKQGVMLTKWADELGFATSKNELYKPNAIMQIADATEMMTITPLYLSEIFTMEDGAAVRTADPSGIRFITSISKKAYDILSACNALVEYGTYIAKTDVVSQYNTNGGFDPNLLLSVASDSIVKITCESLAKENVGGKNQFYACLYGMQSKAEYELKLSAVSFLTIIYANDAMGLTFYTDYSEANNARSILEVAQAAIAAGNGNAYLQSIVDACK